ncbi:hypothetical protein Acsp04_02090 [Actinomadura sp. NBRC 104425]|uniref:hypothetical protein n=1 Tax=Actinomadura sp. NBRC 104425 TaxID=3032204 RepID=UPI0024A316B6|nr:hypothetical protein [Actinomadura sp. NBRC 104425]GLZ09974.1 hypothetical protein Acsp04_02090 [Actinomadura sp. NBRC 104425]
MTTSRREGTIELANRDSTGVLEICPACGQSGVCLYRVRTTGEQFWLCEECDAAWRPGTDRSVLDITLSGFLPAEPNPWKAIERADGPRRPQTLQALVDLVSKGELSGLALGMHRTDALTVVDVPHAPASSSVVTAGDVSLTFEADTLVGIAVRLPPTGVRWPGLMSLATSSRLASAPRPEALEALRDAGFEPLPGASPDDDAVEFQAVGRRMSLEFDQGLLSAVAVSDTGN